MVYLQIAIELCSKFENKEKGFNAVPYIDRNNTNYIVSPLSDEQTWFVRFSDCTDNSQPNWQACREDENTLYLKNKDSKNIYFITG